MRGTVAKRIHKIIYGGDFASKVGKHFWKRNKLAGPGRDTRSIVADSKRIAYQRAKRFHTRGHW